MQADGVGPTTRERLLAAAAALLVERGAAEVSTRAICAAAGVQAPTLYHHFGSKQALLDAVAQHGFEKYLARKRAHAASGDPIADIRAGWDDHVAFGLENPAFYALMYGDVRPGQRPQAAEDAEHILLGLFAAAAEQGRLVVAPREATTQFLSAVVGITLHLITEPVPRRDQLASARGLRDLLLAAFVGAAPQAPQTRQGSAATTRTSDIAAAARQLAGTLRGRTGPLDPPETALLRLWLERLGDG